jgi:hypothetical protein
VVALQTCFANHFPDLEVYRESEDLVIKHGGRFLIVRRVGVEIVSAPKPISMRRQPTKSTSAAVSSATSIACSMK